MSNSIRYIKTLIQFTELKASTSFCFFTLGFNTSRRKPCDIQNPFPNNNIMCMDCIFNTEDKEPKEIRQLLTNIIQTSKET